MGIGPGCLATQWIVDNHVEICFVTPEHSSVLAASLAEYVTDDVNILSWDEIRERVLAAAPADRETIGAEVDGRCSSRRFRRSLPDGQPDGLWLAGIGRD